MAIRKNVIRQRDFSGGEVDSTALRRDDTKIFKAALRRVRNMRPLPTGPITRRPGRTIRYFDGGRHDIVRPVANVTFDVTFAAERFTARLPGGAVVSDLTAPWTATDLPDIVWATAGKQIFVTCRGMHTQVLTYDPAAGTWSIADYDFLVGLSGKVKAPFYRFDNLGVTIAPSALTGTAITLTASAPIFTAGKVGTLYRYAVVPTLSSGRQVKITAVAANGLSATAKVIEALPPTFRVTMAAVDGYLIGEIVEGDTSNAAGQIVAIDTANKKLDILMVKNFAGFANAETLVGQDGGSTVSSSTTTGPALAATTLWDEQFMSDDRGWPGSVSTDVGRVVFCDFPQLEHAILWTAIGAPTDLEVTGSPDAAIFELTPDLCRVLYVAGGSDEFVLTDTAIYFIPISGSTPLAPGSVEFRRIGTAGAGRVKPIAVADGLVFVGQSTKRVYAILATGQISRPYEVRAINEFHEDLFSSPVALAASDGDQSANPGKALYVVNDDGTVVVGFGQPRDDFVGWFPWNGAGDVIDVAARFGNVIFTVRYALNSGFVDTVEDIDNAALMDGSVPLIDFVGTDPLRDSTGDPLLDSTGEPIYAESGALLPFAGETLQGVADGYFLGDVVVDEDGRIDIDGTDLSAVVIGWNFLPEVWPFIEDFEGGDDMDQQLRKRKLPRIALRVAETQTFEADGHVFGSYIQGEDWGQLPPARDATYRYRQAGRSDDPQVHISQPVPGSFTLVEFGAKATI